MAVRDVATAAEPEAALARAVDALTSSAGRYEPEETAAGGLAPLRFRRLVVGVDASRQAELAVAWARALAARFGSAVTLVHATPPASDLAFAADVYGAGALTGGVDEEAYRSAGRRLLEEAAAEFRGVAAPDLVVLAGRPVAVLLRVAGEADADLVVVGSHGPGILERALIGSVADGVKDRATTSVLVAKSGPGVDRVLVGVDGSRASKRAALAGATLARALDAPAEVLHALPAAIATTPRGVEWVEAAGRLDASGHALVSFRVEFGDEAACLLAAEEPTGRDVVVVGSRGLSGIRSLLLGSVSARVLHGSRGSVLVVKDG